MRKAVKRSVSIVLTVLMLVSMCVIGSFTGTAATADDETLGATFDGTTKIYLDSNGCDWWNNANAVMGVSFVNGATATAAVQMTPVAGRTKVFEITVPAGSYTQVKFSRHETIASAAWNTVTTTLPADGKNQFAINSGATGGTWGTFVPDATDPPVIAGPQTIYFDNTNTKWTDVYIYGWNFGLETFAKMELVEGNIYTYTFPQATEVGKGAFLFANKNSWSSQQQTGDLKLEEGKNFFTNLTGGGTTWKGTWSVYTPVEPTVPTDPPTTPTDPPTTPTDPPTVPTDPPTVPTDPPTVPTDPPTTPQVETIKVYYAPSQAWLDAGYTFRVNAQGSSELWTQAGMKATGEKVNGMPVYVAELPQTAYPYGGFDCLQFQAYDSGWKDEVIAINSWTMASEISGKFYTGTAWVAYTPDGPDFPTDPPTEPSVPTDPPTEPSVPTDPPTEPTVPVETITVSFDHTATAWTSVKAYAYSSQTEIAMAWPGVEASATEGNISQFQIEKGKYDTIIFNNGAGQQTISVALEEGKTYVATTQHGNLWYIEGVEPNNITVYFTNSENWATPYAYVYDGANSNQWPGQAMTYFKNNEFGQGVFCYTFDTNLYKNVIFTDGKQTGAKETVSIANPTDRTGYYPTGEMDGTKYKLGTYGVYTVRFVDTTQAPGTLLVERIVLEGEDAQLPTLPVMKDSYYCAAFLPSDNLNITEDKELNYYIAKKTFFVNPVTSDATVSVEGGIDSTTSFNYGDTATLICTDPNFAYWEINGEKVSYSSTYKFIVTTTCSVEAVKTQGGMVYPEPSIFVDTVIYDTTTNPDKILMYFGVHTLNPGENATYGIFRYVNDAPADAATAIQDYLDNGASSAYNSYIKEYTSSGVMNSDGRYNYVASAPAGIMDDQTVTVYAFVVVGSTLYISQAVTAVPGALS